MQQQLGLYTLDWTWTSIKSIRESSQSTTDWFCCLQGKERVLPAMLMKR